MLYLVTKMKLVRSVVGYYALELALRWAAGATESAVEMGLLLHSTLTDKPSSAEPTVMRGALVLLVLSLYGGVMGSPVR